MILAALMELMMEEGLSYNFPIGTMYNDPIKVWFSLKAADTT